jgi:YVTN family beta-propeller protein
MLLFDCKSLTGPTTPEVSFVGTGDSPFAICVNPTTNKIYVTNYYGGNVTVIDGETHYTTTVAVGQRPLALCVNPITNMIYVTNYESDNVAIIYYPEE